MEVTGIGHHPSPSLLHFQELLRHCDLQLSSLAPPASSPPLNPHLLTSLPLTHNPKFTQLKHKLAAYSNDLLRDKPQLHTDKPQIWTRILYTSLYTLLGEIIEIQQKYAQMQSLDLLFDWYFEKISDFEESPTLSPVAKVEKKVVIQRAVSPNKGKREGKVEKKGFDMRKRLKNVICYREIGEKHEKRRSFTPISSLKYPQLFPLSDEDFTKDSQKATLRLQSHLQNHHSDYKILSEMREKVKVWTSRQSRREEEITRKSENWQKYAKNDSGKGIFTDKSRRNTSNPQVIDLVSSGVRSKSPVRNGEIEEEDTVMQPYFRLYQKIPKLRSFKGELLDLRSQFTARNQVHSSLGLYNQPTTPEPVPRGTVPLEPRSLSTERSQQLSEVQDAKQKLAKLGVTCGYDKLMTALVTPEGLPVEKLTPDYLPKQGIRLLKNPFVGRRMETKRRKRR